MHISCLCIPYKGYCATLIKTFCMVLSLISFFFLILHAQVYSHLHSDPPHNPHRPAVTAGCDLLFCLCTDICAYLCVNTCTCNMCICISVYITYMLSSSQYLCQYKRKKLTPQVKFQIKTVIVHPLLQHLSLVTSFKTPKKVTIIVLVMANYIRNAIVHFVIIILLVTLFF